MLRRTLLVGLGLLLGIVAIVAYRAVTSREPGERAVPVARIEIDDDAIIERFTQALRLRTLSHGPSTGIPLDREAFLAFHRLLERSFPRMHRELEREVVSDYSLLFTWPGTNPDLAPALLMGHIDVVPVDAHSADAWTHPPFDGVVSDGFIWGRGAIDDKINVMGLAEAVEELLARDYRPERGILIAFGHDEEIGGGNGAAAIAQRLEERGIRPALVIDEGGAVAEGILPSFPTPVAAVGVAEKGFLSVELTAESGGGHSSAPPAHTTVGRIAAAIHRLERNPMPSHFDGPARAMLETLAPHSPRLARAVLANLWLFGPVVEWGLLRVPRGAVMVRTTTAATIFQAGIKENVLPARAMAVVNFRLFPGDTAEDVLDHVRRVIDDPEVEIRARPNYRDASPISDTDSAAFSVLRRSIEEIFPDAVVTPFLIPGGTDMKHVRRISSQAFGFMPARLAVGDFTRAHGTDERISTRALVDGVRFYVQLMRNVGAWR